MNDGKQILKRKKSLTGLEKHSNNLKANSGWIFLHLKMTFFCSLVWMMYVWYHSKYTGRSRTGTTKENTKIKQFRDSSQGIKS